MIDGIDFITSLCQVRHRQSDINETGLDVFNNYITTKYWSILRPFPFSFKDDKNRYKEIAQRLFWAYTTYIATSKSFQGQHQVKHFVNKLTSLFLLSNFVPKASFMLHCICVAVSCSAHISVSALTTALWYCKEVNWRCSALRWYYQLHYSGVWTTL